MPKKPCVGTLMDNQYVKGFERLDKSAQQYLCHVFDHSERKSAQKNIF